MKEKGTTQARTGKRRDEIIQAALACFVEQGFANTTMEDIRRRSGASTGSIYHHFKSKEQLATAVYLEGIADYQAGFMSQLDRSSSAKKGIASVIRYHLRWVEEHTEWAHYLFQMRHADFMAAAEEDIVEQNRQRSLPFEIVFSLIIFPCFNFARLWLSGQVETDLDSAGRILADAAWRSLKAE
jgi:AcrR family transcriptional regulator